MVAVRMGVPGLDKTERLVRSDPFRSLHRRIVAALERIADVGTLSGDELRDVLDPGPTY
jgi:hypothetical protein